MIAPIQPSRSYDYNNEAQFRSQVRQEDSRNLKRDEPIASFVMTDEGDGKVYRITLSGGSLVASEITP